MVRLDGPWTHLDVRANGIRFHAVEAQSGSAQPAPGRELVLLLHGFGQFWWSWRHQLRTLTDPRLRVVAVDLRGYGDSDKPPRGYDGWTLAGDVHGLIRALGHSSATLVGHADGGLGCWATAALHPRSVRRLALIASPHPRTLRTMMIRDRRQRSRLLNELLGNQLPRLAERSLTRDDGSLIAQMLTARAGRQWRGSGDFTEAVALYRAAVAIPGAAHSSLEYRRWAFRSQFRPDGGRFLRQMDKRLSIPVMALRGADDRYIGDDVIAGSGYYADSYDHRIITDSGHYAHEERPEAVHTALSRFISAE